MMRVLSWNCRGLGNYLTKSYLRDLWLKNKPEFLFLSETKQDFSFLQQFQLDFGYTNLVTVDPHGSSGGLALFYNNNTSNVKVLFQNNRIIDVEVIDKGKQIFLSFVYGDPVVQRREQVWERLTRIGISRHEPWFIIGDLNELTGNHEKEGGSLRSAASFIPFNTMIANCGLLEFPCIGNKLSWRGRRNKKVVRCRLDRALANGEWHSNFSFSFVEYLPMVGSDHRPILATLSEKEKKRKKQFRFDKRWLDKDGLMQSIADGWINNSVTDGVNFVDKIKNCRNSISRWRHKEIPYGREKITKLKEELEKLQNDDDAIQELIDQKSKELRLAYKDEELFWKQKSRTTWLKEGDKNTKFFHAQTKIRQAKNRIIGLKNHNGNMVTSETGIEKIAVDYFNDLFSTSQPQSIADTLEPVPSRVTETMNQLLTREISEEEIRKALFKMHPEKAPGPDGMTALFFQKSWEVIKDDLVMMVRKFMDSGVLDPRLNITHICLIPKNGKPDTMAEFRPISLCNVGYKIISKILGERLKSILPMIVSETQSAFVAGRLISDNILIAQEMFHGLRTNKSCRDKFLAIKTDMSKAYDRVEWIFIEQLLRKLGFSEKWIGWIMQCITSVKYKVLINGVARGEIIPQRGLRQGDPLSPYLFILCTEVLIANINTAEKGKQLTGLRVARTCPSITHLLFADDSLFFCRATKEECLVFKGILQNYEVASGQKINLTKSSVQFGHKIPEDLRKELHDTLGIFNIGGMGSYLGLPESLGGSKCKIFAYLRERIQKRANGWSSNLLSKGGKEILIKSVLTATPTYVMSCFRLPKGVTNKITSAVAQFWWSSNGRRRGMHWKKWKKLCRKKCEGGLGFRVIEDFNTALLAKQLWRLLDAPDSLFARVFKGRYYRYSDPFDAGEPNSPSYGWRSIMSACNLVNRGKISRIGTGD